MKSEPGSKFCLHVVIFLALTFCFGLLPPCGLTEKGMKILGVFVGMLYGWTFISFSWPSMICLVALGFTGYATPTAVIAEAFSNAAVLFTIFVLVFTAYCNESGLNAVLAKWFLSRSVFAGRPWLFTASVLFGSLVISFLIDPVPVVFLLSGILYTIFDDIGMERGEKYPAYLLAGVCIIACISFVCKPWAGQNLPGIIALAKISGGTAVIDNVTLILVAAPACVASVLLYVLAIRFIFRPDVGKLANLSPEYLAKLRSGLRLGRKEGIAALALTVFLALMLLPNLLPAGSGAAEFLGQFTMTVAIVLILGLLSVVRLDGRPVFDYQACAHGINWNVVWMLACSMPVSSAMSSPDAGLAPLINNMLGSLFSGGNFILVMIFFLICVNVATQFAHNVTIILVAVPIIWNLCQSTGLDAEAFSILVFLAAGVSFATPAASTIGALSFANGEWIGMRRAFEAGIVGNIIGLFCIIAISLPLVLLVVGI